MLLFLRIAVPLYFAYMLIEIFSVDSINLFIVIPYIVIIGAYAVIEFYEIRRHMYNVKAIDSDNGYGLCNECGKSKVNTVCPKGSDWYGMWLFLMVLFNNIFLGIMVILWYIAVKNFKQNVTLCYNKECSSYLEDCKKYGN